MPLTAGSNLPSDWLLDWQSILLDAISTDCGYVRPQSMLLFERLFSFWKWCGFHLHLVGRTIDLGESVPDCLLKSSGQSQTIQSRWRSTYVYVVWQITHFRCTISDKKGVDQRSTYKLSL